VIHPSSTVERLVEIPHERALRAADPVLLPADVVRLACLETGVCRGRAVLLAARSASLMALAAAAHVNSAAAARMRIEKHWRPTETGLEFGPDGGDIILVPDPVLRPMPLLPFVRHAVEVYLKLRGNPTEGPLFASRTGRTTTSGELRLGVASVGKLLGLRGDRLWHNLIMFFERALDSESDRVAAGHLMGRYSRRDNAAPPEAQEPVRMRQLRRILEAAHPLSGPANKFFGTNSQFTLGAPGNLPPRARHVSQFSEVFQTDPMVRHLADLVWPSDEKERRRFRKHVKRQYLPHLHALWRERKITLTEVAFLLRLSQTVAFEALADCSPPPGAVIVSRNAAEWRQLLVERWRARPDGERFPAFVLRMKYEIGLPNRSLAYKHLRRAGEIRRRRGRPRRRS
jgi:hypothetical protein